jgi:ferrochelatase
VGTPAAPTTREVRRYLAKFLGDRRVVDAPRWIWKPVLHGIVLRTRPRRSAALYQNVWTPDGSPLRTISEAQRAGVAERLGDGFQVELGMRIGEPTLEGALERLAAAGCERVVVLPLFPQYSSSTTASVFDGVAEWAKERRDLPGFAFVRSFPDDPAWVRAVAEQVRAAGVVPSRETPLVVSFHGIPVRYVETGDPYPRECDATARALVAELGLAEGTWRVAYQSRFGREAWLQPYLFETLAALPREGVRSVAVVTASFVADCLESIDEVGREARRVFEEAGGERFVRVPCPNFSDAACDALAAIVRREAPTA